MNWLIRGIIISIILVGIGALLMFPEINFNKVVTPLLDSIINESEVKNDAEQGRATVYPQPILREPIAVISPAITNTEVSFDQIQSEQSNQKTPLLPPPNNLSGSDDLVMSLVSDINPKIKEWITPTEQIRKWVALIHRIAQGTMSTKYQPLIFKIPAFKVIKKEGRLYEDPENHKRFNALIDVVTSVRPDLLVNYYRYWLPIFDKAYAELGNDSSFSQRMRLAMDNIIIVKPLAIGLAELKQPTSITYKYINSEIENNSDITKWLWRIGPENAKKLQNYLREFIHQLDNS